jgi:hypothetical protein
VRVWAREYESNQAYVCVGVYRKKSIFNFANFFSHQARSSWQRESFENQANADFLTKKCFVIHVVFVVHHVQDLCEVERYM